MERTRCWCQCGSGGGKAAPASRAVRVAAATKTKRRHFAASMVALGNLLRSRGDADTAEAIAVPDKLLSLIQAKRKQPEPVRIPRARVDDTLAVACMRSLYSTVEDLEIVPMNEYQREFWTYRSDIQPDYLQIVEPLKPRIGDLTDPLYLDFISYSQFIVAARELDRAMEQDARFELGDGGLVASFEDRLGDAILARLGVGSAAAAETEGGPSDTEEEDAGGDGAFKSPFSEDGRVEPPTAAATTASVSGSASDGEDMDPQGGFPVGGDSSGMSRPPTAAEVVLRVQAWLDYLCAKGYALKASAVLATEPDSRGAIRMDVKVVGAATLWGTEAFRGDPASKSVLPLATSFDAYATKSLLRKMGLRSECALTTADSQSTLQQWTSFADT